MRQYDYRLVSSGGVGSCAVEKWALSRLTKAGWSAHHRDPNVTSDRPLRVLYIVGNPYNQLLSFYRRGFLHAPYDHCAHVSGDVVGMQQRQSWSLEQYVEGGRDYFMLESHFNGWWNHTQRSYEVMFVRYETIPRVVVKMCEWFDIDEPFVFKPRNSDIFKQPDNLVRGLVDIYGRFAEQVCKLPDWVVKGPEEE